MSKRVCPWWMGYFLLIPLRRRRENPEKIFAPYVKPGMTVLEPGPGMGYFTLELLRRVGPSGRVVAVDIQQKMLERLKKRAQKAGLADRLDARLAPKESMGIADLTGKVDLTVAFFVVHEMPLAKDFFCQVAEASKPGAHLLFAEPAGHVSAQEFEAETNCAIQAGFAVVGQPAIRGSETVLLRKS